MNDFLRLVVIFFAAVNPAAVAASVLHLEHAGDDRLRIRLPIAAGVIAIAVYALACWSAPHLLDWLDIAPESFRVAAGIVMATMGVLIIAFGAITTDADRIDLRGAAFPVAVPLLAGPAGLMAALSYSADDGFGQAFGAAAIIVVATATLLIARLESARPVLGGVARVTGALLVAVAAGLIVSGVRDI